MSDFGLAAYSTFFMQSPSFLAHQKVLERGRGKSNCQTLFGMVNIPTDNQTRSMLDPVPPERLFPAFGQILDAVSAGGGFVRVRCMDGHVLMALDGSEYFCTQILSCEDCSCRVGAN